MKLLQELREIVGFTQDEVAKKHGMRLAEYEKLESGEILDEQLGCTIIKDMFNAHTHIPGFPPLIECDIYVYDIVGAYVNGYKSYKKQKN